MLGVAQRERPAELPRHPQMGRRHRECLVWHSASGQPGRTTHGGGEGSGGAPRVLGVAQRGRPAELPRHTEETVARCECLAWHSASGQPSSHGSQKGRRRRECLAGHSAGGQPGRMTHIADGRATRALGVAQRGRHVTRRGRRRNAGAWCGTAQVASRTTQNAGKDAQGEHTRRRGQVHAEHATYTEVVGRRGWRLLAGTAVAGRLPPIAEPLGAPAGPVPRVRSLRVPAPGRARCGRASLLRAPCPSSKAAPPLVQERPPGTRTRRPSSP